MSKPVLASVAVAACITAALTAGTGASQAAPSHQQQSRAQAIASARANATAHAGVTRGQDARVKDTILDKDGSSHVRFVRTYRGLEVVGGDFVVHQGENGAYRSVSGARIKPFTIATRASVAPQRAATRAASLVHYRTTQSSPRLVVLATGKAPRLAWRVNVEGRHADGAPAGKYVFVGARSGRILTSWPSVLNDGTGSGIFSGTVPLQTTGTGNPFTLVDPTRGGNATYNGPATAAPLFTDTDNIWGDGTTADVQSAGVDAHYGIAKTWDYYKTTFNRTGIANDGKGARSFVHDGVYVNASWSDSCFCMRYGDGDATTYYPLVELDIAGHEMSHGVTSRTAGLTYRGESGGLNEATSDIMGTNVEFYAGNTNDPGDYVIGEEIFRSYNPATNFIRRMDRPSADGASLDCYSRRAKSVDVHYSSGIANHFFYLLSEGTGTKTIGGVVHTSTSCNGSTFTGIGRDAAQRIWYTALITYMTSSTTYSGARVATLNAARDLYGTGSAQYAAVAATWTAVSVS